MHPYYTVGEIHKKPNSQYSYPDDLLRPVRFWSVHTMDTLQSHEATVEDLWMKAKWRNWCW